MKTRKTRKTGVLQKSGGRLKIFFEESRDSSLLQSLKRVFDNTRIVLFHQEAFQVEFYHFLRHFRGNPAKESDSCTYEDYGNPGTPEDSPGH